jgi:drug/metabolite transporter (DMT)-like permease
VALRNLPTATVSTYSYVNPVVAVAVGSLLLGERPVPVTMPGGAVVLVSVVPRYSAASWSSRAR